MPQNSSQNPLLGSVPTGTATAEVLPLSISDAIDRGLRQNLGLLMGNDAVVSSKGQVWEQLSHLMPNLSGGHVRACRASGPGRAGLSKNCQPFSRFSAGHRSLRIFRAARRPRPNRWSICTRWRTRDRRQRSLDAAKLSYQDLRELVVLVVGATYLQAIASSSRVDTAEAQVQTAQALYDQAVDLKKVGASAGIDLLRAQVELQTRQQQRIAARNDFAKQKLALARTIGLPLAQQFTLTDTRSLRAVDARKRGRVACSRPMPIAPIFRARRPRCAPPNMRAARPLPSICPRLTADADYGVVGPTPGQTHGTFSASASLNIPIFRREQGARRRSGRRRRTRARPPARR